MLALYRCPIEFIGPWFFIIVFGWTALYGPSFFSIAYNDGPSFFFYENAIIKKPAEAGGVKQYKL